MYRPDLRPRVRWSRILLPLLALAAATTAATLALVRPPPTLAITVPPAPTPTVTIGAPIVTVNVPPPPTLPDKPVPTPRMLVPYVDAACLLPAPDASNEASPCEWDDGFPAVSADGTTVAVKHLDRTPMDGSMTDASIVLLDTRTMRVVDHLTLFTAADLAGDRTAAFARLHGRVEAARAVLTKGHFVSMISLGDSHNAQPDATQIHAEFRGSRARIVDPALAVVLWQGDPGIAPQGRSAEPHDDQAECTGWNLHSTTLWWHPDAKVVLADLMYFTGGCMCPDYSELQIWRMPDPR